MIRPLTAFLLVAAAANVGWCQATVSAPLPAPVEQTPEQDVFARGPVHEAFAEQISPDPSPGIVVPEAPPEAINEVPPELRPEGDDIVWVPGYWFWDDERRDYVWVSGVWRRPPPGRRWMPGYWQKAATGYQWVAGFWSSDAAAEVEYLESPPETLEAGPSSPSPSSDYFWVPGSWVWGRSQYHWRAGSWCAYRDGWTWVAPRYVWTPRGCIFVSGYWDYTLTGRGYLFAPVYFRTPIYRRLGYSYRPVCWIGYEPLLLHLFVRPHCHHLYFGDYYAASYRNSRYTPCYAYHNRYRGFSSLYVYYQHHYLRHGIDYCGRVRDWHHYYTNHVDLRPARTYHTQLLRPHHGGSVAIHHRHNELVCPYNAQLVDRATRRPLIAVSNAHRSLQLRHATQLRDVGQRRRSFEASTVTTPRPIRTSGESFVNSRGRLVLPDLTTTERLVRTAERSGLQVPTDVLQANRKDRLTMPRVRGQDASQAAQNATGTLGSRLPNARNRAITSDPSGRPRSRAGTSSWNSDRSALANQFERVLRPERRLPSTSGTASDTSHASPPHRQLTRPRSSGTSPPTTAGPATGPSLAEQVRSRLRSAVPPSNTTSAGPTKPTISRPGRPTVQQPATNLNLPSLPRARGSVSTGLPNGTPSAARRSVSASQLAEQLRGRLRGSNAAKAPTGRSAAGSATPKAQANSSTSTRRVRTLSELSSRLRRSGATTGAASPSAGRMSASPRTSRSTGSSSLNSLRGRIGQGSSSGASGIPRSSSRSTGAGRSAASGPPMSRLGASRGGGQ